MDISTQFGKRIRQLRQKNHWTIEDLSFEANINRNYIGDLERGKRNPTLKIIKKIADALKISLKDLFEEI